VNKITDKPVTGSTPNLPAAFVDVGAGVLLPVREGPVEDEEDPMALARKASKVLDPLVAALTANTIPLEQWPG